MFVYVSGGKKCWFFGKFCVRTKWMIPMDISIVSFLVDFKQMYGHSRNVFRTLPNILKLSTISAKSSIFDKVLTLREKCPYQDFSGPYFPVFGLNTGRKNSKHGHFSYSVNKSLYKKVYTNYQLNCLSTLTFLRNILKSRIRIVHNEHYFHMQCL